MTRILPLLLGCLLLGATASVGADISNEAKPDRIYDVEIILFRNEAVPRGQETVLPSPSPTLPSGSIDFSNPASAARAARDGFIPLPEQALQLKPERERLDKSRRYRVLLHLGWRQPGLAARKARAIRIRGGRYYDASYASIDETRRGIAGNARPQQGLFELEGWIRISLSRYLHTEADLVLREPAGAAPLTEGRGDPVIDDGASDLQQKLLINYPLKEKRRMRSKRLHYLDHPQYGLLVLITPHQPANAQTAPAPTQ